MFRTEQSVTRKVKTLVIPLLLVAFLFSSGCSTGHFVQGRVTIKETILPVPQPKPEIVASDTFFNNRDSYKKVAIYFMSEPGIGNTDTFEKARGREFVESEDILELEKTFIRNGYKVLEVRQLTKVEIENTVNESSDFLVFVHNFRDEDKQIGNGEVEKNASFYYGTDPGAINQKKSAEEIDTLVGEKMSMADVVAETKRAIYSSRSADDIIKQENCIFLEAKVVDVKTREVVLFYKAYTFSDNVKLNTEKEINEYNSQTGVFKYDDKLKKFLAFEAEAKTSNKNKKSGSGSTSSGSASSADSSYYGSLQERQSKSGDDISVLSSARLQRLATACDKFIWTIKNYQADRSIMTSTKADSRLKSAGVEAPQEIEVKLIDSSTPVQEAPAELTDAEANEMRRILEMDKAGTLTDSTDVKLLSFIMQYLDKEITLNELRAAWKRIKP